MSARRDGDATGVTLGHTVVGTHSGVRADRRGGRLFATANLLVGLWVLASPLVLFGTVRTGEDDVVVGLVLLGLAASSLYRTRGRVRLPETVVVVSYLIGLWLVAFSLDAGDGALLMYDSVAAGGALAVVDVYLFRRYVHRPRGRQFP